MRFFIGTFGVTIETSRGHVKEGEIKICQHFLLFLIRCLCWGQGRSGWEVKVSSSFFLLFFIFDWKSQAGKYRLLDLTIKRKGGRETFMKYQWEGRKKNGPDDTEDL